MIGLLFCSAIFLLCCVYLYTRRKHNVWQSVGVEIPPYTPFMGHFRELNLKPERWEYTDKLYHQYKNLPYWGMYETIYPYIFVKDRAILKDILVRDSDHFMDRRSFHFNVEGSESDAMFKEMLLHSTGEEWKKLRQVLSPTFTSGKIKSMFPSILRKSDQLIDLINLKMNKDPIVEVRILMGKYSTGVIATTSFGLETPMEEEQSEFEFKVDRLSTFGGEELFRFLALSVLPSWFSKMIKLSLTSDDTFYFSNIIKETIKERKQNNVRREDFLDLLDDCLKESEESEDPKFRMTPRSVRSQAILFLLAGYDTTSNTLTNTLFLLAQNPQAQGLLREEILKIKETDGELTYQNIMDAEYLDGCISESLRIFSIAHFIERKCTEDYTIEKTGLKVKKGTMVGIPVWSLHRDEEYWEEPQSFRPERFMHGNKEKILPYTYMPFGSGPRNCIGRRFALLEAKVAVARIVLEYKISIPEGHEKLVFNNEPLLLRTTEHGTRLSFQKL